MTTRNEGIGLSIAEIMAVGAQAGMELTREEAAAFQPMLSDFVGNETVMQIARTRTSATRSTASAGAKRPEAGRNAFNAWAWKCSINSSASGALSSQRVAIKDNICVAGVPMSAGSGLLSGFVPNLDAEVVTRVLDSGGTIVGTTNCESLCFSSGSHTSVAGEVRNPHRPTHSAGGSSSGNAVVLATGQVELAIGTDTAGSVRTPASACGVFGLKPTRGLTPISGIVPIERSLDCVGPMARSADGIALLLDAMVPEFPDGQPFSSALVAGPSGFRIGVVQEGIGPGVAPDVRALTLAALDRLRMYGNHVAEVSIALHADAPAIWSSIAMEGAHQLLIEDSGGGTNSDIWTDPALVEALSDGLSAMKGALSPSTKLMILMGALRKNERTVAYAHGRHAARVLQDAYDEAFSDYDILVMPTNPRPPAPLPGPAEGVAQDLAQSVEPISNTCAANVTGHPAISVPAGTIAGLPIGLMFIAPWHGERALLRIASAFQAIPVPVRA